MPETRNSGAIAVEQIAPTSATPRGFRADTATGSVRDLADATGGIPAQATYCVIQVHGGLLQWRDDGVDPTAAEGGGMPLGYDATVLGTPTSIVYDGVLADFRYILRSGTPRLSVVFYS